MACAGSTTFRLASAIRITAIPLELWMMSLSTAPAANAIKNEPPSTPSTALMKAEPCTGVAADFI